MPSSVSSFQKPPQSGVSDTKEDLDRAVIEPIEFPEGGRAAWCTVFGGALILYCGFGYTSSFGVYQDFYARRYLTNESPSTISWIGAINGFLSTALGLVAGALHDRGYFYHLIIGGSLLQSFSLFMLSLAQPGKFYQAFLAQGISLGIAQGILYVPTIAVVSHYFSRRRTLAMSLVICGSAVGAITDPILLNNLFNRSVGFANGVRISASIISFLLLVSCFLMRTRLELPKSTPNLIATGKGMLRDVPFCIVCAGLFCAAIGFYYPVFYLQFDSVEHGNPVTFSFYSFVILNGASFIGRLSTGYIASFVGVPWLMIIAVGACGILIFGMIGLSHVASVVVIGALYGFFSGIYLALLAPMIAHLTSDISELGARIGISMTIIGFGSLIGGPVSGALLGTSEFTWWRPSVFNGVINFVGCALLIVAQLVRTRQNQPTEKETRQVWGLAAHVA